MKFELTARYDARKSFYGKAEVDETRDGLKMLYSYNTHVATVFPSGKAEVYNLQSATTVRHVKEFLKQEGSTAGTKAQIEETYMA